MYIFRFMTNLEWEKCTKQITQEFWGKNNYFYDLLQKYCPVHFLWMTFCLSARKLWGKEIPRCLSQDVNMHVQNVKTWKHIFVWKEEENKGRARLPIILNISRHEMYLCLKGRKHIGQTSLISVWINLVYWYKGCY